MKLAVERHDLLEVTAFVACFPQPLGESPSPGWLVDLLKLEPDGAESVPVERSEDVRGAVRRLLRLGGYKPTGRGKPASEYLVRAAGEGALSSINASVDLCNAVSLASGLPISVIDFDLGVPPLSITIAADDASYVFNRSGQEIGLKGLLCLHDAEGPCANAVKDSQRTKTHEATRRTLSVVWGTNELERGRLQRTTSWYVELHERCGAEVETVEITLV